MAAKGIDLGKPNVEFLQKQDALSLVPGIGELMKNYPSKIEVPVDLAVEVHKKRAEISVTKLPTNYPIFDIGAETTKKYSTIIKNSKSIVISGPMGVYENRQFAFGTKAVLETIAASKAFSLVGGGHTIAAVEELGLAKRMGYVSTAGGALIEFLMGEQLPGVVALEKSAARKQTHI